MSIFLSYIFLGLSLAAPIGPINALQIDKGLKNGFLHSWFIGLGSVTADIIYMGVVYMGVVSFLEKPFMQVFLWLFGFFVLTYTGVESIQGANKILISNRNIHNNSLTKTYLTGFFMALANPLNILFWLGIYGSILAKTAKTFDDLELYLYSSAIILGVLLWDFMMAFISSRFRKILTPFLIVCISIISGITLVGFGIYFGIQAYLVLLR
ncbi:amino acid transporter [Bacillus sp. HMF5848]|uniref:LysE family transporter n=1 Tax=Bacillus sp. HMF5848 TaxID=2495421 RepID=UPI000F76A4F1|nr:LysE family transporter [Bacillus sp. HMF5848]RSK27345.1 amino acid transporter [Bacillus sp. HMF5848]